MRSHVTPVDFPALVEKMRANGAFDDYPEPLGDASVLAGYSPAQINEHLLHIPKYPGDRSYGASAFSIRKFGDVMSQELTEIKMQSVMDGLHHYMPQDVMAQWMHEYFTKPHLLQDTNVLKLSQKMTFPSQTLPHLRLDASLSFQLDVPQRSRRDLKLFTQDELVYGNALASHQPALPLAILAYQSAFLGYIERMKAAVEANDHLSPEHKTRAKVNLALYQNQWSGDNFLERFLPSIAVVHHRNHAGDASAPLTQQDFNEGVIFAAKNGVFRRDMVENNGTVIEHRCPAQQTITRAASVRLDDPTTVVGEGHAASVKDSLGVGLFHIYREVEKAVAQERAAPQRAAGGWQGAVSGALQRPEPEVITHIYAALERAGVSRPTPEPKAQRVF